MNRTKKFALNSITSMLSQIIVLVAGLITPRLMIQTYGSEINGLVSSLNQFISYITLVEAGIGGAAIFSLYKPLSTNDKNRISSIVVAANKSYRQAGYLFSAGILALAIVYAILKSNETLSFGMIFSLTIILAANGFSDFFFVSGRRALLTADQRNYIISIASIVNTIARTVLICIMAVLEWNVILVYSVSIITAIIKIVIVFGYTKKQYPYLDNRAIADTTSMNMRYDVVYQQILAMIQSGTPTVLATILLNLASVSVYSVYNMVVSGLNGMLNVFVTGLPAGFGDLIARKEDRNLKRTVVEFEVTYYFILSIVYGLAMVMIMSFISIYTKGLTDVNYYNPTLGFVIVLNGVLFNIKTPQSMLIQSAGLYKETRWKSTLQAVIIIVGGLIFGKYYGLTGILIGSCISNIFRTVDLLIYIPKKVTNNSILHTAKRMGSVLWNIAIISIPSLFIDFVPCTYYEWVIMAIGYGIFALIVTTATSIILEKEAFVSVFKRFKGMLVHSKG